MSAIKRYFDGFRIYSKRAALTALHGFQRLFRWYDPLTEQSLRDLNVEACDLLESERACDKLLK